MKNKLFIGLTLTACLFTFGCQQTNNAVNSNKAANTNTATNSNTPTNANTPTNSNANNPALTAANSNAASTNSETGKKDGTAETKADCKVKQDNADFFVEATEKSVKLKKGTLINMVSWEMHQGLYAVKANINGKWERGEINADLIDCPDK